MKLGNKEHLMKSLEMDSRIDGRKKLNFRDVSVEYGMMVYNLRFKSANNPLDRGMGTAKLSISLRETEYFTKRDYRGTTLRGDI